MMEQILILCTTVLVILVLYLIWKLSIWPLIHYGPFLRAHGRCAPKCLPLPLGHLLELPNDPEELLMLCLSCCLEPKDKIPYYWAGNVPYLLVNKPELAGQILSNPEILSKGFSMEFLQQTFHTGLFTSKGSKWKSRRKLLTPAFYPSLLKGYYLTIRDQTKILLGVIQKSVLDKVAIDARELTSNFALDVICEATLGISFGVQEGSHDSRKYKEAMELTKQLVFQRITTPYFWPDWIYRLTPTGRWHQSAVNTLEKIPVDIIKARRSLIQSSQSESLKEAPEDASPISRKLPLLDLLLTKLEGGDPAIDIPGIQEEVQTFMFAGHDTSGGALAWTLQCLGEYPEVQGKLHAELDSVFNGIHDENSSRTIEFDDLPKLNYLEKVIRETLRLYPPGPMLHRRIESEASINIDNQKVTLPKGLQILAFPFCLHRDPSLFPDPDSFDPDRFNEENIKNRQYCAYIPFGAGPRNCIGQKFAMIEAKTALAEIFRRFRVVSMQPRKSLGLNAELALHPKRPAMLKFFSR